MLYVVEIVFSWSTLVDHIWENDTNSPQTSFIAEVVKEMRDLEQNQRNSLEVLDCS